MSATTYDYVVIGAGSAGCAVAARLSEDPAAQVLLIEAGGSNRRLEVRAPLAFGKQFHSKLDWDYWTEPEPHLNDRRLYVPRGKMLGGTSSMNAMVYIRGNRIDFDGWARDGATGWSYEEVLPYFKRSENNEQFGEPFHGRGGPLNVTQIERIDPVSRAMFEAALQTGIPRNPDVNGAEQDGVTQFQVNHRRGMRHSCNEAFLRPARSRPNLTVLSNSLVTRIVLTRGRASAVEVRDGRGRRELVGVSGEIVLSAGAFNTPALLQNSGIGDPGRLREVGIEPIVDLPAVGEHLMEHPAMFVTWELEGGHVGLADAEDPRHLANWLLRRKGKLTSNVAEVCMFVRTDPGLPAPDFEFHGAPIFFLDHGAVSWDVPAASLALSFVAPTSRGHVRVRSADPTRKPAVTFNMLSDPSEMDAVIEAVGMAREIAAAPALKGVLGTEITPGRGAVSREEIAAAVRASCQHTYHPACTARIGSPEDGAVDPELRVHGVDGLRIADASVMPTIVRGNTHAATVMIGERCADLIRHGRRPAPSAGTAREAGAPLTGSAA